MIWAQVAGKFSNGVLDGNTPIVWFALVSSAYHQRLISHFYQLEWHGLSRNGWHGLSRNEVKYPNDLGLHLKSNELAEFFPVRQVLSELHIWLLSCENTDGISPFSSTNFEISSLRKNFIFSLHCFLKLVPIPIIFVLLMDWTTVKWCHCYWNFLGILSHYYYYYLQFLLKCFHVWLKYTYFKHVLQDHQCVFTFLACSCLGIMVYSGCFCCSLVLQ